jgi:hypothetical protein
MSRILPSNKRLFQTQRVDLAAALVALNLLKLKVLKFDKGGLYWLFADPKSQGEKLTRRFDAGHFHLDAEEMCDARDALFRLTKRDLVKHGLAPLQALFAPQAGHKPKNETTTVRQLRPRAVVAPTVRPMAKANTSGGAS